MQNDDIIDGYQWLACLDSTTCLSCAARDHLAYTADRKPIGHSLPWKRHRHCRCASTPILIPRYQRLMAGLTRPAVAYGKVQHVDAAVSFNDWLRTQGLGFQEQSLGYGRSIIWRTNNLHLMDLLGADGKPLKVSELREKYPEGS